MSEERRDPALRQAQGPSVSQGPEPVEGPLTDHDQPRPDHDQRSHDHQHGAIRLIESACTSCMICARECPSWCITIDSHTEPIADLPPGARERTVNVLDRFAIDWSLCMYCGICVEECPFDALEWAAEPLSGERTAGGLVHEIADLRPRS